MDAKKALGFWARASTALFFYVGIRKMATERPGGMICQGEMGGLGLDGDGGLRQASRSSAAHERTGSGSSAQKSRDPSS